MTHTDRGLRPYKVKRNLRCFKRDLRRILNMFVYAPVTPRLIDAIQTSAYELVKQRTKVPKIDVQVSSGSDNTLNVMICYKKRGGR